MRDTETAQRIGRKLAELRARAGLTCYALAKKAKIEQACLSRYERGKAVPRIETLQRLAAALDVSMEEILS